MSDIKIVRVLVYEGEESEIRADLERRAVVNTVAFKSSYSITELHLGKGESVPVSPFTYPRDNSGKEV